MPEWFLNEEFWKELHDFFFTAERVAAAAGEVENIVALTGIREGSVLDLCCGPGRHSIAFAARGFRVSGVDASEFLLGRARENARSAGADIEWVRSDMRAFSRPGVFSLAVNMYTSFGYFEDPADDLLVLRNMYASLVSGGAFVLTLMSKEVLARIFIARGFISEELADGSMLVTKCRVVDEWSAARVRMTVVRDGRARAFTLWHRLYSAAELKRVCCEAGFSDVRCYGDLAGAEYGPSSERLVVVARK